MWVLLRLACATTPQQSDVAYARDLAPVLADNGLLAERVLQLAGDATQPNPDHERLARGWTQDVVPLAIHVAVVSATVEAPPTWTARHGELVSLWDRRATAAQEAAAALSEGDRARWDRAAADLTRNRLDEEAWFRAANEALAPTGIPLDAIP